MNPTELIAELDKLAEKLEPDVAYVTEDVSDQVRFSAALYNAYPQLRALALAGMNAPDCMNCAAVANSRKEIGL